MSILYTLNWKDLFNGIVFAVLTPVAGYIVQIADSDLLVLDWKKVGFLALSGFIAYIVKRFFSDSEGTIMGSM